MKRKLLLFAAFLSLIPPLRAQETLPAGQEELVLYDNTWTTLPGVATTVNATTKVASSPKSIGYSTNTVSSNNNYNTYFGFYKTPAYSTSSGVYYGGLQNGKAVTDKDQDNPSDKVQLSARIKFMTNSGSTLKWIDVATKSGIHFRALYGKIHKVIIYTGKFTPSTSNLPSYITTYSASTQVTRSYESTGEKIGTTSNLIYENTFEVTDPEGVEELTLTAPSTGTGSAQFQASKIVVIWSPGTPTKPDPVSIEGGITTVQCALSKDEDGNWVIQSKFPAFGIAVPQRQKRSEFTIARVANKATLDANPPADSQGKNLIPGNIYEGDTYTATATSSKTNSGWTFVPQHGALYAHMLLSPATSITEPVVRLFNWNPAGYSEPLDIKIKKLALEAPKLDEVEAARRGMSHSVDADGNVVVTYTELENNSVVLPLKYDAATNISVEIVYTNSGTAPTANTTTKATLTAKTDGSVGYFYGITYKFDMPPVKGQAFRLRTKEKASSTAGPETIFIVKYDGEDDSGDEPKPIVAPSLDVDAQNSSVSLGAGGIINFINSVTFNVSANRDVPEGETATFQYQLHGVNASGAWPQTPEGAWETVADNKIVVNKTGRLFVRETPGAGEEANYSYRDVELISATTTDLGLSGITDGQVVTLTESEGYVITGAYETVVPNSTTGEPSGTKFVYIADNQGRAIKMIIEGNSNNAAVDTYQTGRGINNITGVVRGIESNLPELWITTSAMDYAAFLPEVNAEAPGFTAKEKEVTEVNIADFNKKVVLRGVTFNKGDNNFTTSTGATVNPYARLLTTPLFNEIVNTLSEGTTYSVEGFVGYASGGMVLLPTGAIATPKLLAPNPITASEEDLKNGYITVNVISDAVEIAPDVEGVREGTSLIYSINGSEPQTLDEIKTTPAKITISAGDYDTDGLCVLKVNYKRENIAGEVVEIHLKKHQAEEVGSIAEFKAKYPDTTEPDGAYYRYTGSALVRAITPKYLYLRDMPEGDAEFTKDELSAHSILLYNENGWGAPVAMNAREDEAPRALEAGDIITNFALIADRTHLKNLRGNATGFARTLRREPATKKEYEPQTKDILVEAENTPFDDADRMVRYKINNVTVSKSLDGDKEVFTLDMAGSPELNIGDIFVLERGWSTAYLAGALYDIDGLVIRNGADDKYAVALMEFTFSDKTEPLSDPVLTIEGADPDAENPNSFLTTANIVMESAEGADIYYTTDKSDPRRSATRVKYSGPFEISATTTIKAFATTPGEIPSDVVETEFTRAANDRRFIVNFLDQAEAGVPYHFSGTARVVAKGGEYIFVRGTQGHYLPIHIEDPALLAKVEKDNYVSDFVMEAHIIDADGEPIVRGAHVTADYAPLFSDPSEEKPSTLNSDIQSEPDVVTTITADNARRYVKIMGVRLIGAEFEAEDDEAVHDTTWKLITDKGDGEEIKVDHTVLTPQFDWDEADQTKAAYYNVTGFAMLGDKGEIELWPLEVEKVKSSVPVTPSFTGNITVDPVTADGLTEVEFYPYTTVSLRCSDGATIYYYVSDNGSLPSEGDKWNVYAQPFVITKDSYITMYATAPGYEQSAPTHIDAKLGTPAGTVAFDVTPDPGKTTVKMTAAEGAEIYYTTDLEKDEWTLYTEALSYTEPAMLWAYAKEGVKKGAVSSMYVMVMPEETEKPVDPSEPTDPTEPEQPEQPADRISGRVKFELTDDGQGTVLVRISPADANLEPGKYEIWYTTKTGVTLPEGGERYADPGFEMTESGLVMAVLVEKATGKAVGQTCEVTVWVVPAPTGIDSVGADSSDAVSVEGSTIKAPEGSEIYDVAGRRVSAEGLQSGVYIVRTPDGKAIKVKVD